MDVEHKCWSKEMMDICGVTEEQLPKLYESYEVVGSLKPEVAAELGLSENVKIIAGAGDNAAAAVGTAFVFYIHQKHAGCIRIIRAEAS